MEEVIRITEQFSDQSMGHIFAHLYSISKIVHLRNYVDKWFYTERAGLDFSDAELYLKDRVNEKKGGRRCSLCMQKTVERDRKQPY